MKRTIHILYLIILSSTLINCKYDRTKENIEAVEEHVISVGRSFKNPIKLNLPIKTDSLKTISNGFASAICKDLGNTNFILRICSEVDSFRLSELIKRRPKSEKENKELLDRYYQNSIEQKYEYPKQIEVLPYKTEFHNDTQKMEHGLIQRTNDINFMNYYYEELNSNEFFTIEFNIQGSNLNIKETQNKIDFILEQIR